MRLQALEARLQQAGRLAEGGEVLQAELLYLAILKDWPQAVQAMRGLAQLALLRGDTARAIEVLGQAVAMHPDDLQLETDHAAAMAAAGRTKDAAFLLGALVARDPSLFEAWLRLGFVRKAAGDVRGALAAWFEAVTRAQSVGRWGDQNTTPEHLRALVVHAVEQVRVGRRELLFASYEGLRTEHGAGALQRVDRALMGHLREWDAKPPDERQRPKFFFFPDLPSSPFLDPFLQPWARQLQSAFPEIRAEALRVWSEDQKFQNFLELSERGRMEDYLRAEGTAVAAWEAFFFYRHGRRFDSNHTRCPRTSAVLEALELCRIADHAPEICFSVLQPGTHILPHYGVSNVRVVMHLPLLVPPACALRLVDAGEHCWREGELVMFDDTFQHEAWNRSAQTRIVLLMDCWNPHLTPVERIAVKQLIEMMGRWRGATRG